MSNETLEWLGFCVVILMGLVTLSKATKARGVRIGSWKDHYFPVMMILPALTATYFVAISSLLALPKPQPLVCLYGAVPLAISLFWGVIASFLYKDKAWAAMR